MRREKGEGSTRDNFANDLSDKCVKQEADGASWMRDDLWQDLLSGWTQEDPISIRFILTVVVMTMLMVMVFFAAVDVVVAGVSAAVGRVSCGEKKCLWKDSIRVTSDATSKTEPNSPVCPAAV